MFFSSLILFLALFIDRIIGDPHTRLHPVALIGLFIGWWGRPDIYPLKFQRGVGLLMWVVTASLFTIPFLLFTWLSPWYLYLAGAPFLLKACFALRSLEEHAGNVTSSLDLHEGREKVQMLVSRNTGDLTEEQVLSAAYESVAENLNDSIIAPLFYFAIFGLPGAALYRAANTMDAMLGYRDERLWIGWFPARMDDILSYIPARITGLLLLVYFGYKGRINPTLTGATVPPAVITTSSAFISTCGSVAIEVGS